MTTDPLENHNYTGDRYKNIGNITTTNPLVKYNQIGDRHDENNIIDDVSRKMFFHYMTRKGFDEMCLAEIFDCKRVSGNIQCKFNETIRNITNELDINLMDCVLFLEEYYVKFKKLLSILDGESKYMLKLELSKKYNIKIETNDLSRIIL